MMMRHCGGGGWANWIWMAETFLLWAVVITAVVLVVRHLVSLRGASALPTPGSSRGGCARRAIRTRRNRR
jgi:putative membrane protein